MKIYGHKQAPNPRRVRIFLAEKGVSVPSEEVDIFARDNRKPPFLAKNPLGGIPVLELDDGTCIAESVAICRYFERRTIARQEGHAWPRMTRRAAEKEVRDRRGVSGAGNQQPSADHLLGVDEPVSEVPVGRALHGRKMVRGEDRPFDDAVAQIR